VARRTARDERRRSLAQNFLRDKRLAQELSVSAHPGELVVDLGAGRGALTIPLASNGARVLAVERDPTWAGELRRRLNSRGLTERVTVVVDDMLSLELPSEPYRVVSSPSFHHTTDLLHMLLDDPVRGPATADLIVQWEVGRKRVEQPPRTLLSTSWAPWWSFEIVKRIPKRSFRPIPKVDGAWLRVTKRSPPILSPALSGVYYDMVRANWGEMSQRLRRG
jgi:23S rRNA (adenine-N6)-dimethyltransferase